MFLRIEFLVIIRLADFLRINLKHFKRCMCIRILKFERLSFPLILLIDSLLT